MKIGFENVGMLLFKQLVCHPVANLFTAAFADILVAVFVVSWNL
jgi:hypothetical protein